MWVLIAIPFPLDACLTIWITLRFVFPYPILEHSNENLTRSSVWHQDRRLVRAWYRLPGIRSFSVVLGIPCWRAERFTRSSPLIIPSMACLICSYVHWHNFLGRFTVFIFFFGRRTAFFLRFFSTRRVLAISLALGDFVYICSCP